MLRTLLVVLSITVLGGLLSATSISPEQPPPPALNPIEVENYAQQLNYVLSQISKSYLPPVSFVNPEVRPPTSKDLAGAALKALYETAREPVPPMLQQHVQQVATDQELLALIMRTRRELGDVEPLKGSNAILASCRALTACLDPHSVVVSGEEVRRTNATDLSQGLGLEIVDSGAVAPLTVDTVVPGSPAQRAGVRPGDGIAQINGKQADRTTWMLTRVRLDGGQGIIQVEGGPRVRLTLLRPGAKAERTVTLEQETFRPETVLGVARHEDNSWDYWADREHKIAHVRIATLAHGTAEDLAQVLSTLQAQGMRGLILDLRWCPGGFLDQAIEVARMFLGKGTIAVFKSRGEERVAQGGQDQFGGFPMVALVNGDSSGGAELIAAALQDHKRAVIAGQRTIGKASVQTLVPLPINNTYFKLTSGLLLRPSSKSFHRFPDSTPKDEWGVRPEPEWEFQVSPELNRHLQDAWLLQTLRPGPSNEALELDDPQADPQRQAALRGLLRMLAENRSQ